MNYDGLEVDMVSLGNADSILVTLWGSTGPSRILIDGGKSGDTDKVLAFLAQQKITYLDHIVCSHPHEDHVGGLVGVVKSKEINFGQAWIHLPWRHVNELQLNISLGLGALKAKKVVDIINKSLETSREFEAAVNARGKIVYEPFQGMHVGFLFVCGPSQQYYEQLLREFTDLEKLSKMEELMVNYSKKVLLEDLLEGAGQLTNQGFGLGEAPTEPENNSSTIFWIKRPEGSLLFTADAGVEALTAAKNQYVIGNLRWMQIPHHGSRRNLNEELINYFRPTTAYVSADGTKKHPRRAVVNAFKAVGSEVYSTHYPNATNLWFHLGSVPPRAGYSTATSLYEAEKLASLVS